MCRSIFSRTTTALSVNKPRAKIIAVYITIFRLPPVSHITANVEKNTMGMVIAAAIIALKFPKKNIMTISVKKMASRKATNILSLESSIKSL